MHPQYRDRDSLAEPAPIAQPEAGGSTLTHGIVTGIKANLLSLDALQRVWPDAHLVLMTNGFVVLDNLVPLDLSFLDTPDA
jgi:hypothetical protein